ncbi:MAG: hypothetical protein ACTSUE_26860 [Promethearchaeota archaeon]
MPSQLFDAKTFLAMGPRALECRVKRSGNKVKLKLRTKKMLYTFVTDPETAEALIKNLSCTINEV